MSESMDPRLKRRNEDINSIAKNAHLPVEDLNQLQINERTENRNKVKTIEGSINGVNLKITRVDDGLRIFDSVSLNGNELQSPEKEKVFSAVNSFLKQKSSIDEAHIDEVYDEAAKENEEFDRQRDPYNVNVKPLVDQLFGKKAA